MNHTQLTPAPITAVSMNRAQRRRAERRKAKVTRIALCAAAALTAGVVFSGYGQPTTPEHPDSVFGTGEIFMTYNCGLQGAFDLWDEGITETSYSRDCVTYYEAFMAELEVGA